MDTKVELHFGNNFISVLGSEEFVREQIDIFYDYFDKNANLIPEENDTVLEDLNMTPKTGSPKTANVREFYSQYTPSSQSESALVLAGWIYSQRGISPFEITELKALFDEVGASSPARLDNTIKLMQRDSKKLFQSLSGGLLRPSIYGENYFKSEMKLVPGALPDKRENT
ncbi:MAG: hypothetical protein HY865_17615 [Chloroflexi bacterium]|nr:hypothetical protein [Chloroflexota bacterium]